LKTLACVADTLWPAATPAREEGKDEDQAILGRDRKTQLAVRAINVNRRRTKDLFSTRAKGQGRGLTNRTGQTTLASSQFHAGKNNYNKCHG
jgi:hypothetical protein